MSCGVLLVQHKNISGLNMLVLYIIFASIQIKDFNKKILIKNDCQEPSLKAFCFYRVNIESYDQPVQSSIGQLKVLGLLF